MRIIKIPNLEEETFEDIRKEILREVPFALINSEYLKEDSIGFFYFWDSDYIPKELENFRVQPKAEKEPKFDFSHIKLPKEMN